MKNVFFVENQLKKGTLRKTTHVVMIRFKATRLNLPGRSARFNRLNIGTPIGTPAVRTKRGRFFGGSYPACGQIRAAGQEALNFVVRVGRQVGPQALRPTGTDERDVGAMFQGGAADPSAERQPFVWVWTFPKKLKSKDPTQ